MTIRPQLSATALLFTLLPLAAQAQTPAPAPAPAAVTLRYKFAPGEVIRYQTTTDTDMIMPNVPGLPASQPTAYKSHTEMVDRETVKFVRAADGAATLVGLVESLTSTMNGKPTHNAALTSIKQSAITTVITPAGKLLSLKAGEGTSFATAPGFDMSKMGGTMPAALPDGPIKVGDTWDTVADLSRIMPGSGGPGMQMTVHSALTALDTSAGKTIATISQTYNVPLDMKSPSSSPVAFTMTGDETGTDVWKFDVGAGAIISSDMTMTMHTTSVFPKPAGGTGAGSGPVHMTMQMTAHMKRLPSQP